MEELYIVQFLLNTCFITYLDFIIFLMELIVWSLIWFKYGGYKITGIGHRAGSY
jgi:hypothetical protein